jgi:hypothetical protein
MAVLRFIGALFLLAAAIALTADVTRVSQGGAPRPIFASIAKHWGDFAPQSLAGTQAQVRRAHPILWDPLISSIINLPAWLSLGGMGVLALYLGRRRRRLEIFQN